MDNNDKLVTALMEKTYQDGEKVKIKCATVLHIAEKFGVKPSDIGDICNDRNIRIANCQLGCFE